VSENLIVPKRQTNARSPNVITPSAGFYNLLGTNQSSRIRAKINDKCFIREKKQHTSNQKAESAVP